MKRGSLPIRPPLQTPKALSGGYDKATSGIDTKNSAGLNTCVASITGDDAVYMNALAVSWGRVGYNANILPIWVFGTDGRIQKAEYHIDDFNSVDIAYYIAYDSHTMVD